MGAIIVLADDESDLRSVYAEALRADGHRVIEAADGREAVALVARERPDLLLLDVWMPAATGFEVLDRLRYDPAASSLRVVILSSSADADSQLEGLAGGVTDYWVKGLGLDDFRERVRRVLAESPRGLGPDPTG